MVDHLEQGYRIPPVSSIDIEGWTFFNETDKEQVVRVVDVATKTFDILGHQFYLLAGEEFIEEDKRRVRILPLDVEALRAELANQGARPAVVELAIADAVRLFPYRFQIG